MVNKYYKEFIEEKRTWYKAIKKVSCPILNEDVIFNSKGFHHLLFDGLGSARSRNERMYKLGLLPLVIPVIKKAIKIHDYKPPSYSKSLNKNVEYWILRENVGKQKTLITVILRRIGTGNISFYSTWKKKDKITKEPSR